MILQSLHEYYLRKQDELPVRGFEYKEIPFLLVINLQGEFLSLQDTRTKVGKKMIARKFIVPKEDGRSGSNAWKTANLLWDHYGYVLSWPKSDKEADKTMAQKQRESFFTRIKLLAEAYPHNIEIQAVIKFLSMDNFDVIFSTPEWKECSKISGCNMTFIIEGQRNLVLENEDVRSYVASLKDYDEDEDAEIDSNINKVKEGICLVTGDSAKIARLHPRTPIFGAKSNSKLVSFQRNMGFDSYGQEQSFNAPVSENAAFLYTTALNSMLAKSSKQKLFVGDSTAVFWAEKAHPMEDVFADIFGEPAKENPAQDYKALIATFRAPEIGSRPGLDPNVKFYVLGLAPNAARIAVRFWYDGTVGQVADNIYRHFDDCSIVHGPSQPNTLSLFRLLVSTAAHGDSKNILPNLGGEILRSILAGTPYPRTILPAAINRIKAEQSKKDQNGRPAANVTYPRAALIKAVLVRESRIYKHAEKEVGMALDKSIGNIGYRLGRLFATLEKAQEEASPGINATIRDRFYSSASSAPVTAFPYLMKLKNHHLSKLDNRGRAIYFERLISEILSDIKDFPSNLPLAEQGRFAVGYYHQRNDFFTKNEN